ncbi:hypothetical protein PpBr36_00557 [Pyricularia pennisetigena]|uniref:hypothetical protein n=1 Tax=Pyricularia pennisetigena TaxID=1578925 RepID=UPI00114DE470|nr:hypothetical protein PpBr36_00557 [Pyricularia pennisetigena]TLS27748.1 hypothetical protein PpBr36_00557 [Pyricularia pennisetigena]
MPPNSLVEWMIGQNVSTTKQKKISTFREVVRLQVATDDESGEDSILLTYPRTHQSGNISGATPPGKKVRFDQEHALKDSSSPISPSSSSSSGLSEGKPKEVKTKSICEVSDSDEDSEPHPTCSCADCRIGRRRARRLARLNHKKLQGSSSDASSDTTEASEPVAEPKKDDSPPKKNEAKKKAGKKKSPKKADPEPTPLTSEASDTPGDTTEGTQTEGGTDNEASAAALAPPPAPQEEKKEPADKKTKNGAGNAGKGKQAKKVKSTDEKGSDNKAEETKIDTASQVADKSPTADKPLQLPPYSQISNIRPPNLLMPVKAQVLQIEHAIETPDDPRPNAFIDSQYGVLRVYHGPAYGNALGSLYPRRSWSGKDLPLGTPHPMHNPYIHSFGQHPQGQGHGGAVPDGQPSHNMMPPGWYAMPGGDGHMMPNINQWGMPNTGYQPPPAEPLPNPPVVTAQPPETGGISLKFDSQGRPITSGSAKGSNKDQGWATNVAPPPPTAGPKSNRSQQESGSNKDPWKTNGWGSSMPWGDGASGENAKEVSHQGKGSNRGDTALGGDTGAAQAWGSVQGGSNRSNRHNNNNGGQWATDANNQTGSKGWGGGGSNVSKRESALPGWPTHSPKCPPRQNPWVSSNSGPNNEGSAGGNGGWNDPQPRTTGGWGGGGASADNWNAWGTGSQTKNAGWNEPPKNTPERGSKGGWNAQPGGNSNVAWGGGDNQRNDPAPDAPVDGPSDTRPQGSPPANQDAGRNGWTNAGSGGSANWGRGGGTNSNWSYNNVGGGWGRSGSTKGTPPRPPSVPANQWQSTPDPPPADITKPPSDLGPDAGNWDTGSNHSGGSGKKADDGDKGDGTERMPCTWPTPLPSAHPDGGWPSNGSDNGKITDKGVPGAFFGPAGPPNACDQPMPSDNNVGGAPDGGWANAPSDNQNNNWAGGGGGGGNWNSSNIGRTVSTVGDGGYGPAGNAGPMSEIPPWGDATAAQSTRPEPQQKKPDNPW